MIFGKNLFNGCKYTRGASQNGAPLVFKNGWLFHQVFEVVDQVEAWWQVMHSADYTGFYFGDAHELADHVVDAHLATHAAQDA